MAGRQHPEQDSIQAGKKNDLKDGWNIWMLIGTIEQSQGSGSPKEIHLESLHRGVQHLSLCKAPLMTCTNAALIHELVSHKLTPL